jgi:hypothetical protein
MDHLQCPSQKEWNARADWIEEINDRYAGMGGYILSEQACAMMMDVQSAFCAGAWVAVVILSLTVVDAQLRETELPGFSGNTKMLIDAASANSRLHKLRLRRNALIHLDPDSPAITVDQQWLDRERLEAEAREAIELMFEAFYITPFV